MVSSGDAHNGVLIDQSAVGTKKATKSTTATQRGSDRVEAAAAPGLGEVRSDISDAGVLTLMHPTEVISAKFDAAGFDATRP